MIRRHSGGLFQQHRPLAELGGERLLRCGFAGALAAECSATQKGIRLGIISTRR
jgi:hypothetical protein